MPRAKDGTLRKEHRKKLHKLSKGYWGRRKNLFRTTKDAVSKSLLYAYRDRRNKKRDFRRLWITRISAAARASGIRYSLLMHKLFQSDIQLNRKILSNLAVTNSVEFDKLIKSIL